MARCVLVAVFMTLNLVFTGPLWAGEIRNVVLLIGDGMGFEQIKAASHYAYGTEGMLVMEQMPHKGRIMTRSANYPITDSAAAATAIAAGRKVDNDVVSVALPGDGAPIETILEVFQRHGRATGVVTTTTLTHATPASFAGHSANRNFAEEIARSMLATRPTVMLGGGENGMTVDAVRAAGYTIVTNREEMNALSEQADVIAGLFGKTHLPYEYDQAASYEKLPHLREMAAAALKRLERHESGFFLMIEGGKIDHAGHMGIDAKTLPIKTARCVHEVVEFDRTIQAVLEWAQGREDTLVIVTADHETGGLKVVQGRGAGEMPEVTWEHGIHTNQDVPIFASGPGAERFKGKYGVLDNTAIFHLIKDVAFPAATPVTATQPVREAATVP